jgi:phosphoribosyl 1,2-cyclic phosphodiesterase
MRVRFWGVRGSVSWSTAGSIRHGCNTPCVEVRDDRTNDLLILDAGSGVVGIGERLGSDSRQPVPILLTHYHWDHLQGLPFFAPFYQRDWSPALWAPVLGDVDLAWVDTIFKSPFFPVPFEQLPSRPKVTLVEPGEIEIGRFHIRVQPLRHPGGAFAYRIQGPNGDLVYATDHEFGDARVDEALAAFCLNAGAVILDAHFTPDELPSHQGWGHGTWRQCAEFASATGAGHLWLFHHKPGRTDGELERIQAQARQVFPATTAAAEGVEFII